MSAEESKENLNEAYLESIRKLENQFIQTESVLTPSDQFGHMESEMIQMRDGIKLATRIFFPKGEGPWPVILERSPYPHIKEILEMTSKQFAKYGFVVVSQSCRGKGASEGEWAPFENERNDGLDTIDWIIQQSWMNGKMGMYGHSYGGFEQWIVADQLPREVKTLFLGVFGTERYRQMYMNGMFRHEIYTAWAVENAGHVPEDRLGEVYQDALMIRPHINMDSLIGEELTWYRDWVCNVNQSSDFWQTGLWSKLKEIPQEINIPIFMIGGWFDHQLDGMVHGYNKLPKKVKKGSRFIIGPWIHTLGPGGDLDYPNSEFSSLTEAIKWFNHQLMGDDYAEEKGVLETYIIGENRWTSQKAEVNDSTVEKFYLNANHQKVNEQGLSLSIEQARKNVVSFSYDPQNPVRTKGGEALLAWINPMFNGAPPASVVQDTPEMRDDVISFISEPLETALRISGSMKVHLEVATDVEDTAYTVKVLEVFPDGKSYNIRDGITSLVYRNGASEPQQYEPNKVVGIEIELWPITWTIKKESRLRLDISSSNFPAYHIHSNFKGPWAEQKETKVANQKIYIGDESSSYIEIPIRGND